MARITKQSYLEIALGCMCFNHLHLHSFGHFIQGSNFSKAASARPNLGQIPTLMVGGLQTFQVTFPSGIVNGKIIPQKWYGHIYQRKATQTLGNQEYTHYILLKRIPSSCTMSNFSGKIFKNGRVCIQGQKDWEEL